MPRSRKAASTRGGREHRLRASELGGRTALRLPGGNPGWPPASELEGLGVGEEGLLPKQPGCPYSPTFRELEFSENHLQPVAYVYGIAKISTLSESITRRRGLGHHTPCNGV